MLMKARHGFTAAEIIAVIAIIAVLAAVIIPQALSRIGDAHASALSTDLKGLSEAIEAFRGNVGRYPDSLTYLTTQPTAGRDACQSAIPAQQLTQWRGPYINRAISSAGLPVGDMTIRSDLIRNPATIAAGNFGVLYIEAENVDQSIALKVESAYDGGAPNLTSGNVIWTLVANNRGTLRFAIPIKGC